MFLAVAMFISYLPFAVWVISEIETGEKANARTREHLHRPLKHKHV